MVIGFHVSSYEETEVVEETVKIGDRFETLRDCVAKLLDGFGWRPLSSEWDYSKTVDRVRTELFAEETQNCSSQVDRSEASQSVTNSQLNILWIRSK